MNQKYIIDEEALLANLDGWVFLCLKKELSIDDKWMKIAENCQGLNSQKIFCSQDIKEFKYQLSPANALLNELIKRCITAKYMLQLLKETGMTEILSNFLAYDVVKIKSQKIEPTIHRIYYGKDIHISIDISGFPLPSFLWFKGETPLIESTTNSLTIKNFRTEDEGIYLCYIQQYHEANNVELWSEPYPLFLKPYPPYVVTHPDDQTISEGGKLLLSCKANCYPPPIYRWMKNGEIYSSSIHSDLTIDETLISDGGSYQCIIINDQGQDQSRIVCVKIIPIGKSLGKLEIINQPILCEHKPERSIGQSFSLICSARSSQNIIFTWIINGSELVEPKNHRYIIMTSANELDYSSCLFYTVSNDDGSSIHVLCSIRSSDCSLLSNEVIIKVAINNGPNDFKAGMKWAFLVANTDYSIGPLPSLYTPSSDMQLIAQELNAIGYHCLLLTNLNLVEFKNALTLFSQLIKPGDYVVFCYAGHGLFNTIDQLIPIPNENSIDELETLSSIWAQNILQKNEPALLFVVLDMCRHIIFDMPIETFKIPAQRNCIVLHATSVGYQSLEDRNTSSVLTSSLVQHLQDDIDVVSMARSVLRDIAHRSRYVRCEQIPKLDVNLCDSRSLKDPIAFFNAHQERTWASLTEFPPKKIIKKMLDSNQLTLTVSCNLGGEYHLVSNVMIITLDFCCDLSLPPMSIALNVKNEIKVHSRIGNKVIYEMRAIQMIKVPLLLTVVLGINDSNKERVELNIPLGLPGIAKVKIYDENISDRVLQGTCASFNIR